MIGQSESDPASAGIPHARGADWPMSPHHHPRDDCVPEWSSSLGTFGTVSRKEVHGLEGSTPRWWDQNGGNKRPRKNTIAVNGSIIVGCLAPATTQGSCLGTSGRKRHKQLHPRVGVEPKLGDGREDGWDNYEVTRVSSSTRSEAAAGEHLETRFEDDARTGP